MDQKRGLVPKMDTPEQKEFWEFVIRIGKEVREETLAAQERWNKQNKEDQH